MCHTEVEKAESLTYLIESEAAGSGSFIFGYTDGKRCNGMVMDDDVHEVQCEVRRRKSEPDVSREATIFTLNYGDLGTFLLYWSCSSC